MIFGDSAIKTPCQNQLHFQAKQLNIAMKLSRTHLVASQGMFTEIIKGPLAAAKFAINLRLLYVIVLHRP